MQRPILIAALAAIVLFQGGCISASLTRNVTTGQELIDLHQAHASGAITDSEYVALKSRLISESTGGGGTEFHAAGSSKP